MSLVAFGITGWHLWMVITHVPDRSALPYGDSNVSRSPTEPGESVSMSTGWPSCSTLKYGSHPPSTCGSPTNDRRPVVTAGVTVRSSQVAVTSPTVADTPG